MRTVELNFMRRISWNNQKIETMVWTCRENVREKMAHKYTSLVAGRNEDKKDPKMGSTYNQFQGTKCTGLINFFKKVSSYLHAV